MKRTGRVERFPSVEAMESSAEPVESSPPDFARFMRHCARLRRLTHRPYPRGVFRFRGIDDPARGREQDA